MYSFLGGLLVLLLGYALYARYLARLFGADPARVTPALASADGVDFIVMPPWKVFLIQLLNIAGWAPSSGRSRARSSGPWPSFGSPWAACSPGPSMTTWGA